MLRLLSHDDVVSILRSFFVSNSRSPDILIPESAPPETEAKLSWVEPILQRTTIHDEDFVVFRHFRDPASTVLDIGAHYGYSAASIWASGASTAVVSFEPIQGYKSILELIKRLRKGRFDFMMTALGDRTGSITFTTPVVSGRVAAALTTALPVPDIEGMARNIFRHAARFSTSADVNSLKFYQFTAPITTLDEVLANHTESL